MRNMFIASQKHLKVHASTALVKAIFVDLSVAVSPWGVCWKCFVLHNSKSRMHKALSAKNPLGLCAKHLS